jgi:hypothetical protein
MGITIGEINFALLLNIFYYKRTATPLPGIAVPNHYFSKYHFINTILRVFLNSPAVRV